MNVNYIEKTMENKINKKEHTILKPINSIR